MIDNHRSPRSDRGLFAAALKRVHVLLAAGHQVQDALVWIVAGVERKHRDFTVCQPVHMQGFNKRVWTVLRDQCLAIRDRDHNHRRRIMPEPVVAANSQQIRHHRFVRRVRERAWACRRAQAAQLGGNSATIVLKRCEIKLDFGGVAVRNGGDPDPVF